MSDQEFDTMGDEEFATVGYAGDGGFTDDELEAAMGQIRRRRDQARRGMSPQQMRAMMQRGGQRGRGRGGPPPQRGGRRLPPPPDRGGREGGAQDPTDEHIEKLIDQRLHERLPSWFAAASKVPGAGAGDGQLLSPLGLGSGVLSAASPIIELTAQPQRPFRGERLIINLARSAGAATTSVTLEEFKIGENSQLVGSAALPAETFNPTAFGVRLAMSPSSPGIVIFARLQSTVPGGESITVTAAIIGRAVWSETG